MELMTKYQYTYFIYPYIIDEKQYKKYLQSLLRNKNCKLRIFNKQKDIHLYTYFLPNIRDYMFWSFETRNTGLKNFNKLDSTVKSTLLAEHDCNIFNYEIKENLQGKVDVDSGIFFEISEIKIICYKTGVCFLVFKTNLENTKSFSDLLNFNYKFREINSIAYSLKEYENIKIQSSSFKNVKDITELIKEITGNTDITKKANIGNDKFFVYSYACLDQKDWNENTNEDELNTIFEKYSEILPQSSQIVDDKYTKNNNRNNKRILYKNQYIKYGFTSTSTVLLTSTINTSNFTIIPQKYESEYLYTYILTLYKKLFLNKLNYEFKNNFKKAEESLINFSKNLWIQDVTNDEFGKSLEEYWTNNLDINLAFNKIKNQYDISYKKHNVEELNKNNKITRVVVITILIINILTIIYASLK